MDQTPASVTQGKEQQPITTVQVQCDECIKREQYFRWLFEQMPVRAHPTDIEWTCYVCHKPNHLVVE